MDNPQLLMLSGLSCKLDLFIIGTTDLGMCCRLVNTVPSVHVVSLVDGTTNYKLYSKIVLEMDMLV